jgi:signal transduction histidine kinase
MTKQTLKNKLQSLRVLFPILLLLFAICNGVLLYFVEMRIHESRFEKDFSKTQMLQAYRIQADIERWLMRNDMEMVQSIFAELGVNPDITSSLFLDSNNIILASSRREYIGVPLNIEYLGLEKPSAEELELSIRQAKKTMKALSLFSGNKNNLIACLPASLPLRSGELKVRHGGIILISYNLRFAKASNYRLMQYDFLNYFAFILFIAIALGVGMHYLITRRLERLKSDMTDFADGRPIRMYQSGPEDEISHLVIRFNEMACIIRKSMEDTCRLNRELENRVTERTARLEAANNEIEALTYSLAHDLRTPLRAIDGYSQLLFEEYPDKLDATGRDYLQRTRLATQRIGEIIDDMLNLLHISRTDIVLQVVDLSNMVKKIADSMIATHPDRHVEFIIRDGISVQADRRLMQIVLENLIGNAWKFTSGHPIAHIEFGVEQRDEKLVNFIRDDGSGFDNKYAHKLFHPFQRLHDLNEFPGTGVGLALVQRIMHQHGGDIWAEGEIEKGATFYFTIP